MSIILCRKKNLASETVVAIDKSDTANKLTYDFGIIITFAFSNKHPYD